MLRGANPKGCWWLVVLMLKDADAERVLMLGCPDAEGC